MRIIVFFDLPVIKTNERREYQRFRKFLLNDGYDMLQYSVYCRICNGVDGMNKHLMRLDKNLPPKGSVRVLTVTDKQYESMKILVGKKTAVEKNIDSRQLSFF